MTLQTFPTLAGLTFPVRRTPIWSTIHQEAVSGADAPLQLWTYPRWRYELQYDFLRSDANAELQSLAGFFNKVGGSASVFKFSDPDDGSVTTQGFGTGDGSTRAFGLVRTFGGFTEPVFAPIIDSNFKVFDNGSDVTSHVTVGTAGLVTWDVAPTSGHALTWTGSFNWLCRFDDDSADFEKFMNQLFSLGSLRFTTVKTTYA